MVAAVGKAAYISGEWIREGAIVFDVGINRGADGKLCGDVEFAAAAAAGGLDHAGTWRRGPHDHRDVALEYRGCRTRTRSVRAR